MTATYHRYILNFKRPSGTSRGVLNTKETWFIKIEAEGKLGVGECGLLRGLSVDDRPDYEAQLRWTCQNIALGLDRLYAMNTEFPSIQFGLEMAFKSLESQHNFELFPSAFTQGKAAIPINGLIWMGDASFMKQQIKDKIDAGYFCIKLKIGAIDFETEINLLKSIRRDYSSADIELRVDANSAFQHEEALEKIKRLSALDLHSIEQPIKPGQFEAMAELCAKTPLPIALDEELIGICSETKKEALLQTIQPQYIILKPSFIGGFRGAQEWIDLAYKHRIGWWVTSALESNVGLNAIAQWTYNLNTVMVQGLGTGGLFTNNFKCPLQVKNATLRYENNKDWKFEL